MCHTTTHYFIWTRHDMLCHEMVVTVRTSSKPFAGRVAVVTGVGSGIGRALTYELAVRGAILAISDINDSQLDVTAQHARSLVPPCWPIISTSPTAPQCCPTPRK